MIKNGCECIVNLKNMIIEIMFINYTIYIKFYYKRSSIKLNILKSR